MNGMEQAQKQYDSMLPPWTWDGDPLFICSECDHETEYGSEGDACEECSAGVMTLAEEQAA